MVALCSLQDGGSWSLQDGGSWSLQDGGSWRISSSLAGASKAWEISLPGGSRALVTTENWSYNPNLQSRPSIGGRNCKYVGSKPCK